MRKCRSIRRATRAAVHSWFGQPCAFAPLRQQAFEPPQVGVGQSGQGTGLRAGVRSAGLEGDCRTHRATVL